jgi:hypothetical protein
MTEFFCVVLFCVGTGRAMGRSTFQGDLPKYTSIKEFIVSEVYSKLEQARGPNPSTVLQFFLLAKLSETWRPVNIMCVCVCVC